MRRYMQYKLGEVSWVGSIKKGTVNLDEWLKDMISAPGGGIFLIREAALDQILQSTKNNRK
jgi:hypothetical protein